MQVLPGTWTWVQQNLAGQALDPNSRGRQRQRREHVPRSADPRRRWRRGARGGLLLPGRGSVRAVGMLPETQRYVANVRRSGRASAADPERVRTRLALALALVTLAALPGGPRRGSADVAALQVALRAVRVYGGTVDGVAWTGDGLRGSQVPGRARAGRRRDRGCVHADGPRPARADPPSAPGRCRPARPAGTWRRSNFASRGTASPPGRSTAATAGTCRRRAAPLSGLGRALRGRGRRARDAGRAAPADQALADRLVAPIRVSARGPLRATRESFHPGLDYPAPTGTTVRAAGRGLGHVRRLGLGRLREPGRDRAPRGSPIDVRAPLARSR